MHSLSRAKVKKRRFFDLKIEKGDMVCQIEDIMGSQGANLASCLKKEFSP